MSVEIALQPELQPASTLEWQPPSPPTDLIFDDGEPLETNRHRNAMNVLIRSLQQAWSDRQDYFTGGNMFIYFSDKQVFNKDFRGPDFFAVLDIDGSYTREGWVVWLENGRYPDVIVELTSSSTAVIDKTVKKALYERTFRTPDYFVYNPFDPNSLEGWHIDSNQKYQPLVPNEKGWLWSETLGFWLGTWEGTVGRDPCIWLRFYDQAGNLVLLPEEAAQLKADEAELKANEAELKANEAELKANEAKQKADEAERKVIEAKRRAERLAARLLELGEDPSNL
ncbi:Putative restriction endonuclease domain-containing protein [Tumidithrix helvetica PCC 7403]|uniref:Uma2 family endonuclease n=1 Tax=Tumidithrix helvetica TaxID=3457545 RepID=UPI003C896DFD